MEDLKQQQKKQYEIQGRTFTQKPVTVRQFRALMEIVAEMESSDVKGYQDILALLSGPALVDFFSRVIFPGQGAEALDWDEVAFDQIDEVMADFFGLNPRLKQRFKEFFGSLMPILAKAMEQ